MFIRSFFLFLGIIFPLGFGIYVLVIDRKGNTNRIFSAFAYLISFFFFCHFMLAFAQDRGIALFWAKIINISLFIPPLFLSFIIEFLYLFQRDKKKRYIIYTLIFCQPIIILIYHTITGFKDITIIKFGIGYLIDPSNFSYFVLQIWALMVFSVSVVIYVFKFFITRTKEKKSQASILLVSFILILLILITAMVNQKIKLFLANNEIYFFIGMFILTIISLTYAIRRFRFFNLNLATASEHIIATMKDGLFICDRQHIIHFMNKFACTLTGFSISELRGISFKELLFDENYHHAQLNDIIKNQLDSEIDLILKTKDRGSLPCSCIFSFFQVNGTISPGYICIVRNISTRKVAEAALKAAKEKSENANKAKSEFLANMSHEIRTPLNIILGMSDMLKNVSHEPVQEEYIDAITYSGNILLRLLNNVLDMAQIESGKLLINQSEFNLYNISHAVFSIEKQNIQSVYKNIGLLFEYDKNIPRWFSGDSTRIQEILLNLMSNAVKFTDKGYVRLHISGPEQYKIGNKYMVHMIIEDTGIGIPASKQKNIFKAFYQVDGSVTRKYGGSGLGLAIISKLISIMKGKIKFTSEEGKGTVFNLDIPLKVIAQPHEKPGKTKNPADSGKTSKKNTDNPDSLPGKHLILIAEDDDLNRKMLLRMGTVLGYNVDIVSNGKEVLKMLKIKSYSLILMDNHMPGLDGISTTNIIRKKLGLKVPIIGLTGDVFKETKEKCLKAGMDHFLSKPFRMDELKKLLDKFVKDE